MHNSETKNTGYWITELLKIRSDLDQKVYKPGPWHKLTKQLATAPAAQRREVSDLVSEVSDLLHSRKHFPKAPFLAGYLRRVGSFRRQRRVNAGRSSLGETRRCWLTGLVSATVDQSHHWLDARCQVRVCLSLVHRAQVQDGIRHLLSTGTDTPVRTALGWVCRHTDRTAGRYIFTRRQFLVAIALLRRIFRGARVAGRCLYSRDGRRT